MKVYQVKLAKTAKNELAEIVRYITEYSFASRALKVSSEILAAIDDLDHWPERYKLIGIKQYRCRYVKNYIIFFTISESQKCVTAKHIIYSKRNWINLI